MKLGKNGVSLLSRFESNLSPRFVTSDKFNDRAAIIVSLTSASGGYHKDIDRYSILSETDLKLGDRVRLMAWYVSGYQVLV